MSIAIVHEMELRKRVGIDADALRCIAESFGWLHDGLADVPPVAHVSVTDVNGDVDIKTAYVAGLERLAVKIASGFPGNVSQGLASGSGLMVVLSTRTGYCEAVLLDNGYLTDLRTALAGAVAADHLAPDNPATVGIIGTGVQARLQLRCLALVRRIRRVVVWGRTADRVGRYVKEMQRDHQIEVQPAASLETLVRESDLIVSTTASREPLLHAHWLRAGQHITAVGSDFPGKQELHPSVLERADRLYCDRLEQCLRLGELQHWPGSRPVEATELGAVVRGAAAGRSKESDLTVCDLTGVGVQDTAIANLACTGAMRK